MPYAFYDFKSTDEQKNGPVSEFWEKVHLAESIKEDTNYPNNIIPTDLMGVCS